MVIIEILVAVALLVAGGILIMLGVSGLSEKIIEDMCGKDGK